MAENFFFPRGRALTALDFAILPFLILLYFSLSHVGFPFIFCIVVVSIAAYLYSIYQYLTLGNILRTSLFGMLKLFFRELDYRGRHKLDNITGPVLFVCGPHGNQFLDPICVMYGVNRPVGFITAAKSMRRKWVGLFARAMNSIAVERPQDLAKSGKGSVSVSGNKVSGVGTAFQKDLQPGYQLVIKGESYQIASVESDTALTLSAALGDGFSNLNYSLAPKLDQSAVFEEVWCALRDGKGVGIFPEGGSHDRSDFLPLKAGVTIMAFGAVQKYGCAVTLVPVGINYFSGHRFRSRAMIDFGDPITISRELQDKYNKGGADKREACAQLLDSIVAGLKGASVTAPDHDTLHMLWAVRRLYKPHGVELTTAQKLELTRRLETAYEKLKDDSKIQQLRERVLKYNQSLASYGIRDHEVNTVSSTWQAGPRLVARLTLLIAYALAAFPGFVLNGPIILMSRVISSSKAKEAKAQSSVKIEGKDVLGTWKLMVMMTLLPLCFIIYPTLAGLVGWLLGWGALNTWSYFALLQPFLMYSAVRITERGLSLIKSLPPLFYAVRAHEGAKALVEERRQLAEDVQALVDEYGPRLIPQFEEWRIIKSAQFKKVPSNPALATPAPSTPSASNSATAETTAASDSSSTADAAQ